MLRRHLLFVAAFCVGLVLRVLTVLAYPQAYLINDSRGYVHAARSLVPQEGRQSGVALFLRLIPHWQGLTTVTAVQHVLGLALAVLMYAVLHRRGVPGWAATLATLPVLVDPFQLNLEHYILTDFLFQLLLSAGLLLLLWWRRIPTWGAAIAGALLGLSLIVRGVGDLVIAVVVVVAVGQARWRPALALLAATVVPVFAYMGWYHHTYGRYSTGTFPSHILYGRVMTAVDCPSLHLPSRERSLCIKEPARASGNQDWYVWNRHSAWNQLYAAKGGAASDVVADFDRRAIRQQPLRYAKATLRDAAKGFAPRRTVAWTNRAPDPWLFSAEVKRPELIAELTGDRSPALRSGLARFMTRDNALYFPGPLFAAGLLLALLSVLVLGRRYGGGQRSAIAVLALPALLLVVTPAAVAGFSWRYQLPQLSLIPPAAALAATAVVRRRPGGSGLRESLTALLPRRTRDE